MEFLGQKYAKIKGFSHQNYLHPNLISQQYMQYFLNVISFVLITFMQEKFKSSYLAVEETANEGAE